MKKVKKNNAQGFLWKTRERKLTFTEKISLNFPRKTDNVFSFQRRGDFEQRITIGGAMDCRSYEENACEYFL